MGLLNKQHLNSQQLQLFQAEFMNRRKSPGIAWLLWFFAGYLGGHRFYLGRIGTGIGMLITGGGMGIWWLVDIFLMNGMIQETNDGIEAEILQEIQLVEQARANEERLNNPPELS